MNLHTVPVILLFAATGCHGPGSEAQVAPTFDAIAESESVSVIGTEPFWGATVADGSATYSSPEQPDGTDFAVSRFAGNNGVSFSGKLDDDRGFDLMVTPGTCRDGMSDREYPFVASLKLGSESRNGCAWTAANPFKGDANP